MPNPVLFSTFKTRTLNRTGHQNKLAVCSTRTYNVGIIGIQEHRFYLPNSELEYRTNESYQLIISSAWKNARHTTAGGVALLLSSKAKFNLLQDENISSHILVARFQSNPKTTVISCYTFYDDLFSVLSRVPAHDFLSLSGDFNARLGPENALFTYNSEINRNEKTR